jgi:glycine oxidase
MKKIMDITIIGSGIMGLLTAKALIDADLSVNIIEKNSRSLEASWAGGGILLPLYPWQQKAAISTLVQQSLTLYPRLSEQLIQNTGIDPEWVDCGLLICQNPNLNAVKQWCQQYNIAYQLANFCLFKSLQPQWLNPLWLPTIAQIRNPRLLKALRHFLAQQPNVQFIDNCTLTNLTLKNQTITEIYTTHGKFPINHLLLTTGAWTGTLTQSFLKKPINIEPVKGQMLLFNANVNALKFMVLDDRHYLIPRRDGKILAGSTIEYTAFDQSTTEQAKNQLHDFATTLMPALKKTEIINHWAGLRPATKEGVPYIDRHPEIKNLSINAGHFRNGLVMAPASAQLITDLILEQSPSLNPDPYKLTRAD